MISFKKGYVGLSPVCTEDGGFFELWVREDQLVSLSRDLVDVEEGELRGWLVLASGERFLIHGEVFKKAASYFIDDRKGVLSVLSFFGGAG